MSKSFSIDLRRIHVTVLACLCMNAASAQITTDGSVGAQTGIALNGASEYAIGAGLGTTVGNNLFHSFSQFDVGTGETAVFDGSAALANIVSRVTGGDPSDINGTIRSTAANANVFLVNPAGIVFGPTASLDVPQSFVATSADRVSLSDGGVFDASSPGASVLTAAPPSAFGFVGAAAAVTVNGATLTVPDGKALTLVGGDVNVLDATLKAPGGTVSVAATAGAGTVTHGTIPALASGTPGGTVLVRATAAGIDGNLDASSRVGVGSAGSVFIRGGHVVLDGGRLITRNFGTTAGGDVDIDISGTLTARGGATIDSTAPNVGGSGDIRIKAGAADLGGGTRITAQTSTSGSAGSVTIDARELIIRDSARVTADTFGSGAGGAVRLLFEHFTFQDTSFVSARTAFGGSGPAGTITLNGGSMVASGDATLDSSSFLGSAGSGGRIVLMLDSLTLNDEAWIISNTTTAAAGGAIEIQAGSMQMNGSSAVSTATFAAGDGGDITITADQLGLSDSAVISSGTQGTGQAGTVTINAGTLTAGGSSTISSESEGSNAFVRDFGIPGTTTGGGDGGDVRLNANRIIVTDSARIATGTGGSGDGGNLNLAAARVDILGAASVSARSDGTGLAGNIDIAASDTFWMQGGAVTTEANTSDGGNIAIKAEQLILIQDGRITTSVSDGDGDGGNISIDPPFIVLDRARIVANANGGAGGNITLVALALFADPTTVIDASSNLGIDGTVIIDSPNDDVSASLTALPTDFLSESRLALTRCAERTRADISTIVLRPRDGLPPAADDLVAAARPDAHAGTAATRAGAPAVTQLMLASLGGCGAPVERSTM